jgi:hypothetical protein
MPQGSEIALGYGHGAQVRDRSVLEYQIALSRELVSRDKEGSEYRTLLEDVLGFSTEGTVISTSEHVAPFNRAHTVSFVLPQLACQATGLGEHCSVLIMAGSLIPLDNSHYPRGFFLPDGREWNHRFNLYPSSMNKMVPLLLPPAKVASSRKTDKSFSSYLWLGPVLTQTAQYETLANQLAACMETISTRWFSGANKTVLRVKPLEEVASSVLIRLLENSDPIIHSILFDSKTRHEIAERLHGVFCAWGNRQGSFLFWATENSHVVRLREEDGYLVGGAAIRVPFEVPDILQGLRTRSLMPGVFLALLAISYLPNLPISGGPKQLHYYRRMIEALNAGVRQRRPLSLSALGYMTFDPTALQLRLEEPRHLTDFGTGLELSSSDLDVDFLFSQLSRTEVAELKEIEYCYE